MVAGRSWQMVTLVLNLLGRDLGWSQLTGGRYSEVVVNTGYIKISISKKRTCKNQAELLINRKVKLNLNRLTDLKCGHLCPLKRLLNI